MHFANCTALADVLFTTLIANIVLKLKICSFVPLPKLDLFLICSSILRINEPRVLMKQLAKLSQQHKMLGNEVSSQGIFYFHLGLVCFKFSAQSLYEP